MKHGKTMDKGAASVEYERITRDRDNVEVGTVKFYDPGRGFGFVTSGNTAKPDVYLPGGTVRTAGLTGSQLEPGVRIEYVRARDKNGRADCAVRIRLV